MRQFLILFIVAIVALAGGITVKHYSQTPEQIAVSALPEFTLSDLSGQQHRTSEWRGKILVINFWATWCPPCLKEIPEFIKLQKQYTGQNLQFIGVAIDDDFAVADFIKTTPINYPNLLGQEQGISLAEQLGNAAGVLPFTVIVDPQGQIIHRQHGELSVEKILTVIKPLLKSTN